MPNSYELHSGAYEVIYDSGVLYFYTSYLEESF